MVASIFTGRELPNVPQPFKDGEVDPVLVPAPPLPPRARVFRNFKEVNVMRFVNCTCFRDGQCLHQAAPRAWFGPAICIEIVRPLDPRIQYGCALRIENEKNKWTAPPPKKP